LKRRKVVWLNFLKKYNIMILNKKIFLICHIMSQKIEKDKNFYDFSFLYNYLYNNNDDKFSKQLSHTLQYEAPWGIIIWHDIHFLFLNILGIIVSLSSHST
jgi:hypothetical protein